MDCCFGDLGNKVQRVVFRPATGEWAASVFVKLSEGSVVIDTGECFNAVTLGLPQQIVCFANDQPVETLNVDIPN